MAENGAEQAEYHLGCSECTVDTGGFRFESPQKATDFSPDKIECQNCGQTVTPIVLKRLADIDNDQDGGSV